MGPALVQGCPKCKAEVRVLRAASAAVICASCRQGLRIAGSGLVAEGELPLPPLKPHRFQVGTTLRLGMDVYTVAAIEQFTDQDGTGFTEYALFGPGSSIEYLEQGVDGDEWCRYVPLKAQPSIAGDTLTLDGSSYKKSGKDALKTLTAAGEFVELPEPGEKYASELYEGKDGEIVREIDAPAVGKGEVSRYFRLELLSEQQIKAARMQAAMLGAGSTAPAAKARPADDDDEDDDQKKSNVWGTLAALVGFGIFSVASCESDPSCEQRAQSAGWGAQQLQECRNSYSGRGSYGYSGGK